MEDNDIRILNTNLTRRMQGIPLANPEHCICRVNNRNQQNASEVYSPNVFSIGPFHPQLYVSSLVQLGLDLYTLKSCYLREFLNLNPELKKEDYIKALGNLEGRSRRCYGEQIFSTSYQFMEMLLVDGCFIIVLFLTFKGELKHSLYDPIFTNPVLLNTLRNELLLFENQIPFFILQCLFNITGVFNKGPSFVDLALNFFNPIIPGHRKLDPADCAEVKHLLDLIRRSYAPSLAEILPMEDDSPMELEYGAWDLQHKAAVKFKKGNNARSLLDINFRSDAVMEIPPLKIEMSTILLNFIAYEQRCGGPHDRYISDYVSFMASLLKNQWDAGMLMKSGIFYYADPFTVFNTITYLSSKCTLQKSHYSRICKKVKRHCDSTWRVTLAIVWHDLLSFPQVIPFGLAVILVAWFVKYLFSFF